MIRLNVKTIASYLSAKRYMKWRVLALVLIALVLASRAVIWYALEQTNGAAARNNFDMTTRQQVKDLQEQFEVYANTLYASRALFTSNDTVSRADWNSFIDTQRLTDRYPALYAVGFITVINHSDIDHFTAQLNANRLPTEKTPVVIRPVTDSDTLAVITYAAPSTTTQGGIGTNVWADGARAQALATARDTGLPQASKPVQLAVDPSTAPPGFLVVLPVYTPSATSLDTVASRRAAILGYVGLALRSKPLLDKVFAASKDSMDIAISNDGTEIYEQGPTFSGETLKKHVDLAIAGKTWTLDFTASPDYGLSTTARVAPTILFLSAIPFLTVVGLILYFATRIYNPDVRAARILQERQSRQNSNQ